MAQVLDCNLEASGPSQLDIATVEKAGLQCSPQSQVLTLTEQDPEGCSETYHHEYSEGGTKAWLTVAGASLALFCTFGQMNAFGTFQSWYSAHQLHHLPPSTISWIGSIQLWIFFFSVRAMDVFEIFITDSIPHRVVQLDAYSTRLGPVCS